MKKGGEAVKLNLSCHLRYAHALFAVKDRDLGILEANFAPNICDFLDFVRPGGKQLPHVFGSSREQWSINETWQFCKTKVDYHGIFLSCLSLRKHLQNELPQT